MTTKVVIGEKKRASFLSSDWKPEKLDVFFPDSCPHCGGAPVKKRGYSTARRTGVTTTHVIFQVPVCGRVLPSVLTYMAIVVFAFTTVVFGLAALFSIVEGPSVAAIIAVALSAAGLAWAVRAHTWFRIAGFDKGSLTFKVRRPEYAELLAKLNA